MANISVEGDTSTHGSAPFDTGLSANVNAGGKAVASVGQAGSSLNDTRYETEIGVGNIRLHPEGVAANQTANAGSATVFVNGNPVHRVGDARIDGATAGPGIDSVQVG
jgi:uncharacterized Zn-binding protein involved in type VI secretion